MCAGYRTLRLRETRGLEWLKLTILMCYRKIFPPTQEELPHAENKAKNGTDEIEKGWEAVDKPSEAASEKAPTDISEEGEKVEAPDLGADDGEKVEKPIVTEPVDELAESGEVLPKSGLMKDW